MYHFVGFSQATHPLGAQQGDRSESWGWGEFLNLRVASVSSLVTTGKSELTHAKDLEMPDKHEHCRPQLESWGCRDACP